MKKIFILLMLLIAFNSFSQWDFGCDKVEVQDWDSYKSKFVYKYSEPTITVFSFEDDFTLFSIKGYVNVTLLTKNMVVEGNKLTFDGIDSTLDEVYIVLDYDYGLMKIMANIDGKTVLFIFNIISQKENQK